MTFDKEKARCIPILVSDVYEAWVRTYATFVRKQALSAAQTEDALLIENYLRKTNVQHAVPGD